MSTDPSTYRFSIRPPPEEANKSWWEVKKPTETTLGDFIYVKSPEKRRPKTDHHCPSGSAREHSEILGNALDSSPSKKRGKEKRKRPTLLKKKILKEVAQEKVKMEEKASSVEEGEEKEVDNLPLDRLSVCDGVNNLECLEEDNVDLKVLVKRLLHTSQYRDYCDQALTEEVCQLTKNLLEELVRFQDRLYKKDPIKAATRKRLGFGLREVLRDTNLGKVKCLILAPNIKQSSVIDGVLDRTVENLKKAANEHGTPIVYALSRLELKKVTNKPGYISAIAVYSYDGCQEVYHSLMEEVAKARELYANTCTLAEQILSERTSAELKQLTVDSSQSDPKMLSEFTWLRCELTKWLQVKKEPKPKYHQQRVNHESSSPVQNQNLWALRSPMYNFTFVDKL